MEQSQPRPTPIALVGGGDETRVGGTQGAQQEHIESTSDHIGNSNTTSVISAETKPMEVEAKVSVGS